MKSKVFGIFITIGFLFSAFLSPAFAQEEVNEVIINADETIEGDYLTAGEEVKIYGTINGDLYVAGGNVIVDGEVNGDLLVAGGNVSIEGTINQDVRSAGGQVIISGEIGDSLTVLGGNVRLSETGSVDGSVIGAGGNLALKGPVGGDIYLGAGNLELDNEIGGNVQAWVGRLSISPETTVAGDLIYWSDQEASIQQGAEIGGETTKKQPRVSTPSEEDIKNIAQQIGRAGVKARYGITVFKFISSLIIGLLLIRFYPNFMNLGLEKLEEKPWTNLGVGFAVLFLTPILLILMMITLIGIPLALILGFSYGLMLYFAKFFVVFWAGRALIKQFGNKPVPGWSMVIGLAVYFLISFIPFVNFWVKFFTLVLGLGVLITTYRQTYLLARDKKVY